MARFSVGPFVLIVLAFALAVQAAPPAADARKGLESLAPRLKFFNAFDFMYDRVRQHQFTGELGQQYEKLLSELTSANYDPQALIKLLKHEDPKVRTLALAALFAREDPQLLPHMLPLVDDQAATFSKTEDVSIIVRADFQFKEPVEPKLPPLVKQTVGEVASLFVNFYLERADYRQGVKGMYGNPGFDAYWAAHKDRKFCASWFAVQLARACQGTSPTQRDRFEHIRAVRKRIDLLPGADRAWTLLWLHGETGSDVLVSEAELVGSGKELGPERLLLMLQRKIPSDDVDLKPRKGNNWPSRRMTRFVLEHAKALLRPEDAAALLACEAWERDYAKHGISDPTLTAWWTIAAAELKDDPVQTQELLLPAFARFRKGHEGEERAYLAIAVWRLVGPDASEFLVKWFYEEGPPFHLYPHPRVQFLEGIAAHRKPAQRKFIVALARVPGFDTLDWLSLKKLTADVNAWSDKPLVDPQLVAAARHPYGEYNFDQAKEKATKDYPKETEALLQALAQWRSALRTAILESDK